MFVDWVAAMWVKKFIIVKRVSFFMLNNIKRNIIIIFAVNKKCIYNLSFKRKDIKRCYYGNEKSEFNN